MHTTPTVIASTTDLPEPRLLQARQRAAEHCAAQALARWRSGVDPREPAEAPAAMQAQLRWHRQMQDAHVAWLQAGGFAQG